MISSHHKYKIKNWYQDQYWFRTRALNKGEGKIDWVDPGTRVSWSEVVAYAETLGLQLSPLDRVELGDLSK